MNELIIPGALLLDFVLGDPRRFHPVVGVGRLTGFAEVGMRRLFGASKYALRFAGFAAAMLTLIAGLSIVAGFVYGAEALHEYAGLFVAAVVVWSSIAVRSLFEHSSDVSRALNKGDLPLARNRLSRIVGRDTQNLSEQDTARAAIESVAESVSDGITAPLFFAALGAWLAGAPGAALGAAAYRIINTMDSMFGYKNEKYRDFGLVPARLDDLANLLPSRLTVPFISLAALLTGENALQALRIWWRDGGRHTSPNAGQCEAAFAGALGLRLGGVNLYGGVPVVKPEIGDARFEPAAKYIARANRLMLFSVALFAATLTLLLMFP